MWIAETIDLDNHDSVVKFMKNQSDKIEKLEKENEQLKQSYKEFEDECQSTFNAMNRKQNDLYRKNFKLKEENEQLKQDRFICLDCKHSGYTEIGCLCEKEDHWTDYKTECEDYEELE